MGGGSDHLNEVWPLGLENDRCCVVGSLMRFAASRAGRSRNSYREHGGSRR